jgi:hypothetical protein
MSQQATITKTRADWPALRLEYVNSTMTQRELAAAHGINASTLMARANKEQWEAARKQHQAETSKAAQERLTETKVDELAQFNADDLRMAKALRGRAAMLMQNDKTLTAAELRSVATTAAEAQKIGRLALGAETARTVNENRELKPIEDEDWL